MLWAMVSVTAMLRECSNVLQHLFCSTAAAAVYMCGWVCVLYTCVMFAYICACESRLCVRGSCASNSEW